MFFKAAMRFFLPVEQLPRDSRPQHLKHEPDFASSVECGKGSEMLTHAMPVRHADLKNTKWSQECDCNALTLISDAKCSESKFD